MVGERWVEPDMEDVFTAYSQGYDALLKPAKNETNFVQRHRQRGLQGVPAYLSRPARLDPASDPAAGFHPVFGHAFEAGEMTNVPALLINRDETPRSATLHRSCS